MHWSDRTTQKPACGSAHKPENTPRRLTARVPSAARHNSQIARYRTTDSIDAPACRLNAHLRTQREEMRTM
eukprot:6281311-Prymnesium_polylepis.1